MADKISIDRTVNKIEDKWLRPWNLDKFDDLYNRDERFFSILVKGAISFLNRNIIMYNKPINHFIFNTGSSYMYVESNGYEFNWNETSGEDTMYMQLPRCIIELAGINIDTAELTQSFARGNYERKSDNVIVGYNAEIKRIPIVCNLSLHYVLGNFNECIILIQEIIDRLTFQKYFKINYLGNIIQCSIELPQDFNINLNKIDLGAPDTTQRTIDINVVINTNYPIINTDSAIRSSQIISSFGGFVNVGQRSDNVIIMVDGKNVTDGDIFLDLRKFDFNKDGKLNESEIDIIQQFLDNFDIDGDGFVTQHDIDIIEEEFMNNTYNIKYDILNKGELDPTNLIVIKELFSKMDFDNDNMISEYEIKYMSFIIHNLNIFDFDNDLIITYNDLNKLINYVANNYGLKYVTLWEDFLSFYKKYIDIAELLKIISEFLENDWENLLEWLDNCEYKNQIDPDIWNMLIDWIKKLVNFKTFDLNGDGIIDEKDIDLFISHLSEHIHKEITYYNFSSIIIHSGDHTLSPESITDIVEIGKQTLQTEDEE